MSGLAYYNEFDPQAAAWLRENMRAGLIAAGEIDTRSIVDVQLEDIKGFSQIHLFAGLGIWSYALRLSGWSDEREAVTVSCPCQPFSMAGERKGLKDERHLWPEAYRLIKQRDIDTVFGEQVAKKDGIAWLDIVQTDLEGSGYAVGPSVTPACGFGAPHIRQRTYFSALRLGHSEFQRLEGHEGDEADRERRAQSHRPDASPSIPTVRMGDTDCNGQQERMSAPETARHRRSTDPASRTAQSDRIESMAYAYPQLSKWGSAQERSTGQPGFECCYESVRDGLSGKVNGFWSGADWLRFSDNKWRPCKPGVAVLVDESAGKVLSLRGFGNGIVAEQAKEIITATMDAIDILTKD